MAIRRFREHVTAHNWFAVAVDVAIVVLGVFLGLQVNNWNQARIEAAQARDYRRRLIDELDFNARQFAQQVAYFKQARRFGVDALAALEGSRVLSDRDFLIAAYQLTQNDTTKAKRFVYDEMMSSGLIGHLGDSEVQQFASDYYLGTELTNRQLDSTFPYRSLLREVMPYDVQLRIRRECGDRLVYYKRRLVGLRLVVPCPMTLDPATASRAARIVRSTPDIRQHMTRYIAFLDEKIDNLEIGIDQSQAFKATLMAAAARS